MKFVRFYGINKTLLIFIKRLFSRQFYYENCIGEKKNETSEPGFKSVFLLFSKANLNSLKKGSDVFICNIKEQLLFDFTEEEKDLGDEKDKLSERKVSFTDENKTIAKPKKKKGDLSVHFDRVNVILLECLSIEEFYF